MKLPQRNNFNMEGVEYLFNGISKITYLYYLNLNLAL